MSSSGNANASSAKGGQSISEASADNSMRHGDESRWFEAQFPELSGATWG